MHKLESILEDFRAGKKELSDVMEFLKKLPFEDLSFARVDHHRRLRRGFPEVIYGEGKTPEQIVRIIQAMEAVGTNVLVTRVCEEKAEKILTDVPGMVYHPVAKLLSLQQEFSPWLSEGTIQVICAGSSDVPVAEEAAITCEFMGNRVERFFDVGVAGLQRLLGIFEQMQQATVHVVVAGMEGALPSVVAGLVKGPVIAVPTSVGYGASFGGIAALLGMLNSCAPGVSVVNIDNGFGAGYLAGIINLQSASGRNPDAPVRQPSGG